LLVRPGDRLLVEKRDRLLERQRLTLTVLQKLALKVRNILIDTSLEIIESVDFVHFAPLD
jgi:hypothetical protein